MIERLAGTLSVAEYRPSAPDRDLVLLHSMGVSGRTWRATCTEVGERHRCLAIDSPGQGGSPAPASFLTIADISETVYETLLLEGLEDVIVVGNSMGATIAVDLAARHPRLVRAVVLVGAALWRTEPERRDWMHSRSAIYFAPDGAVRPVSAAMVAGVFGGERPEFHRLMVDDQRRAGNSLLSAIWALYSYDVAAALRRIEQRVLAVYGSEDPYRQSSTEILRETVRHLEEHTVPDGSHLLPLDKPHELASVLERWLTTIPALDRQAG